VKINLVLCVESLLYNTEHGWKYSNSVEHPADSRNMPAILEAGKGNIAFRRTISGETGDPGELWDF